jgi:hypothetical protein
MSAGRAGVAALMAAMLAALSVPGLAAGASEPQITSAGIDANDRLFATWQLAPGTTFDTVEFASSSIVEPLVPGAFLDVDNFAGLECVPPPRSCDGNTAQTSYRESLRVSRDRRYFVVVNARAGRRLVNSAIWVIDDAKPLLPGEGEPSEEPVNAPVFGHPLFVPPPETIPAPLFSVLTPPKRIGGLVQRGIRVRLTCPAFECYADLELRLGKTKLASADPSVRPGGRQTLRLRPSRSARARLRARSRVRVRISADVIQPGGKRTRIAHNVLLRR